MLQWDEIFSIGIVPQQNKQSFIFLKKNFAFSIYLLLTIEFLKVHKIEIFFGFDFEICIISLLVMSQY